MTCIDDKSISQSQQMCVCVLCDSKTNAANVLFETGTMSLTKIFAMITIFSDSHLKQLFLLEEKNNETHMHMHSIMGYW